MGRGDVLFPAGVGELLGIHGTHGTHADQSNRWLLVYGVIWSNVDWDVHGGNWQRVTGRST